MQNYHELKQNSCQLYKLNKLYNTKLDHIIFITLGTFITNIHKIFVWFEVKKHIKIRCYFNQLATLVKKIIKCVNAIIGMEFIYTLVPFVYPMNDWTLQWRVQWFKKFFDLRSPLIHPKSPHSEGNRKRFNVPAFGFNDWMTCMFLNPRGI